MPVFTGKTAILCTKIWLSPQLWWFRQIPLGRLNHHLQATYAVNYLLSSFETYFMIEIKNAIFRKWQFLVQKIKNFEKIRLCIFLNFNIIFISMLKGLMWFVIAELRSVSNLAAPFFWPPFPSTGYLIQLYQILWLKFHKKMFGIKY
jgi:hypothetical protein